MNLEPRVSCASHNSLPRAKDKKRQKWLGLDVQAIFQSHRVQQVAPTVSPVGSVGASALCAEVSTGDPHPLQGRQKGLFNFDEARFSHFIDSLRRTMFAQSSLIHLYYLKFKYAGAIDNRPCVILFRLNALHL